jgi:hypothetical protein
MSTFANIARLKSVNPEHALLAIVPIHVRPFVNRGLLPSSDGIPDFPQWRALRMVFCMCTPARRALSIFTGKEVTMNVKQATVTD